MIIRLALSIAVLTSTFPAYAQGLTGLGPPGGLSKVPPEVTRMENALLGKINTIYRKKTSELRADTKLRGFARAQAERAARGQSKASELPALIESRKLAPFGYYFQFVFGETEAKLLKAIEKDRALAKSLSGEFSRIGIGAFLAPAETPFFQVMLLLAKDLDPRAGQPGLSKAQTDPVMNQAAKTMKDSCYDLALRKNPNLRGQVLFELRIGPRGHVDSAKLLRGVEADQFDPCVLSVVQTLRFPEPYKGVPVTLRHPIQFNPPQGTKIVGLLTDGQVRSTFARVAPNFRKCLNDRLEQLMSKKLKGRIELEVDVSKTGNVTKVKIVDDTTLDEPLQRCVTSLVEKLRFPEPKYGGPTTVRFPIDFGK
ncbi:MAG: TonB family protein [Myxococcota bacterium]